MIRRKWAIAAVIAAFTISAGSAVAGKVCDLAFSECPGKFTKGVVNVPPEMIWLDAKVPYCNEFVQITNGKPPSIVFIIDNSGSMDENDPQFARFEVVSALLDNIASFAPSAEVGLVIFTRRLSFDHRENPLFKPAFPGDTSQHDSYVPLTALNKKFPNGYTGLDTLKALLKHDDLGNLIHVTRMPASRNNIGMGRANTRDGTDITLGFQAAKVAMKDSKSDRSGQFFVFLSDGTAANPDSGRDLLLNDFIAGTTTPTTFTVFFDTQNPTPVAPPTIVQMTANIKVNSYSPMNPTSAYWAINLPGSQLQEVLQTKVLGNVLSLPAKPKSATLSIGDSVFHATGLDTKDFIFAKRLVLKPDTTRLALEYTYTYLDTSGGVTQTKEKVVPYPLIIVRKAASPIPVGLGQNCRDQADISLFHGGQPVATVLAEYERLEARLTMPDGSSACKGCRLEVSPSSAMVKDHEALALTAGSGYLSGSFAREVSLTPALGDGRLQHIPKDSIVILYVSPENPLDKVRKAFPYRGVATVLNVGPENDYARARHVPVSPFEPQFLLIGPAGLKAAPTQPSDHWRVAPGPMAPPDSLRYVGLNVEASRAFVVDIHIFSNLGEFVNKLGFTVNPIEFEKLSKSPAGTRSMKVLWDSRSQRGSLVATGAYVVKTTVTLLKIPGIAEDDAVKIDYRRVGVLRSL